MERLNRTIALVLVLVALASFQMPVLAQQHTRQGGEDWCKFSSRTGTFASVNAFAFGLMPGLQPVGIAFGAYAVGARVYHMYYCT